MAIKFQYNKISLQEMQKQLRARTDALPVLVYKEAILRSEAEKAKKAIITLENKIQAKTKEYDYMGTLWQEFPKNEVVVNEIKISRKNIAGVKSPQLESIKFEIKPLCLFNYPFWISDGIILLKDLARLSIEKNVLQDGVELLEAARKKTTQKVNLYQKVQVPGYLEAVSKVRKYLQDEESLQKAGQKIMKKRMLTI